MSGSSNGVPSLGALLDAARGGERGKVDRLIVACQPVVQARVEQEMGPELLAVASPEDVRQDVLAAVCGHLAPADFPNDRALRGWLRTLVRNRLVDLVRRHVWTRWRLTWAASLEAEACDSSTRPVRARDLLPAREPGPYATLRKRERSEIVRRGLRQLAPSQRDILDRIVFHGETVEEIARREELTRDAVWKRFRRALRALRRTMGSESFSSMFRSSSR